ncbi:GSK3-beta interaction protein [Aphelenchoides besseyi]|nr:GSK3-beta interaction protein [Aphelenchoides besseyi]KAI6212025.1 GSK3-beta interaction protein [Aphelenchoides besseyi]
MDPPRPISESSTPCGCYHKLSSATFPVGLDLAVPFNIPPNANALADCLKISPLYRQADSQRWQTAAHVYHSSRHSPAPGAFSFPIDSADNIKSPLSLEEIGSMNRRQGEEISSGVRSNEENGALELEAIAAVHELSSSVRSISVSEILPRTADLIFVNLKTHEDLPFTLELTMKGWRIASTRNDCMNGDYMNVDLHTQYFRNAREVLDVISPGHSTYFNSCLTERLRQLQAMKDNDEFEHERWNEIFDFDSPTVVSIPVPQRVTSVEIDAETAFD